MFNHKTLDLDIFRSPIPMREREHFVPHFDCVYLIFRRRDKHSLAVGLQRLIRYSLIKV